MSTYNSGTLEARLVYILCGIYTEIEDRKRYIVGLLFKIKKE